MSRSALTLAFVVCASASAAGEEITFQLYSSPRVAPLSEMRRTVVVGPVDTIAHCFALAALILDNLAAQNPDSRFLGRCGDGDMLDANAAADRALSIIEPEGRTP